jgi:hypothetical protein
MKGVRLTQFVLKSAIPETIFPEDSVWAGMVPQANATALNLGLRDIHGRRGAREEAEEGLSLFVGPESGP